MSPVCGKCGDRGYEETLICCFMCQDAYEHRYCFNKASDIFKRDVKWACEDCLPIIRKKPSPKKTGSLPSRRSERISTRSSPASKAGSAAVKVGEISPPSAKRTKQKYEEEHTEGSMECKRELVYALEKKGDKDIRVHSEIEVSQSELFNESLSDPEEAKSHSGATLWVDAPGAQPIMDPIWKGSFEICYKKPSTVWGVAAHLSTLACPKAQQEASLLPVALYPRVVPRSTVWPKSFQKAEPKDESIGLYFFPERDRDAEAFDSLVNQMISGDLAMICVVKNAELLVFTSIKLPCDYWRFQGKRYLWGVFRAKQSLPI